MVSSKDSSVQFLENMFQISWGQFGRCHTERKLSNVGHITGVSRDTQYWEQGRLRTLEHLWEKWVETAVA